MTELFYLHAIASGFKVKYYKHNISRMERLITRLEITKEIQITRNNIMYNIDNTNNMANMGHSMKEQLTWRFWNTAGIRT